MTDSLDSASAQLDITATPGWEKQDLSIHTDLRLVGRTFRQHRRSGVSRPDAERAAIELYCSFHPDVAENDAREAVAQLIKASSEAGLIWTENH